MVVNNLTQKGTSIMNEEKNAFSIKAIHIQREGYGTDTPFIAKVSIKNNWDADMVIRVDEGRTLQIIDVIDDLIVEALSAGLDNMKQAAIAAVEAKRIADHSKVEDAEFTEVEPAPFLDEEEILSSTRHVDEDEN